MLRFENINKCLSIDKEIGIEKINEKMSLNIHINMDYNNKMIIDNKTKSLVKDYYLPQSGTIAVSYTHLDVYKRQVLII